MRRARNDTAASAHFRRLEDGRLVFYPTGEFGRWGYIVDTPDQEFTLRVQAKEAIRRQTRHAVLVGMLLTVALQVFHPIPDWTYAAVVGAVWILSWIGRHLLFYPVIRTMARVMIPNAPVAIWREQGRVLRPLRMILGVAFVMAYTGFFCYVFALSSRWVFLLFAAIGVPLAVHQFVSLHAWWTYHRA